MNLFASVAPVDASKSFIFHIYLFISWLRAHTLAKKINTGFWVLAFFSLFFGIHASPAAQVSQTSRLSLTRRRWMFADPHRGENSKTKTKHLLASRCSARLVAPHEYSGGKRRGRNYFVGRVLFWQVVSGRRKCWQNTLMPDLEWFVQFELEGWAERRAVGPNKEQLWEKDANFLHSLFLGGYSSITRNIFFSYHCEIKCSPRGAEHVHQTINQCPDSKKKLKKIT